MRHRIQPVWHTFLVETQIKPIGHLYRFYVRIQFHTANALSYDEKVNRQRGRKQQQQTIHVPSSHFVDHRRPRVSIVFMSSAFLSILKSQIHINSFVESKISACPLFIVYEKHLVCCLVNRTVNFRCVHTKCINLCIYYLNVVVFDGIEWFAPTSQIQ